MNNKDTGLVIMGLGALYLWYTYEPPIPVNPLFTPFVAEEGPEGAVLDTNFVENTNNLSTIDELIFVEGKNQVTNIDVLDIPATDTDFGIYIPD